MDFEQGKKQLALGTETLKEKIPYFPYSVAGIIILLLGALFFFFSATQSAAVTIAVVNAAGANVRDAQISVTGLEAPLNVVTDKNGIANFTVPVGSNIRITVKKQDYADENKSVLVSDNLRLDFKLKQKGIAPPKEINVLFVGPDGKKLIGKQVSIKLSCTGPAGFDPDQLNVTQGELKLVPPANCGSVKINASSSGFKEGFATLTSRTGQVTLEGLERPKASVDFDVKDAESNRYVDGLVVSLFTLDNIPTGYSSVTSFGSASFTKIEADSYIAIIDDPQGQYSNKRLDIALTENAKEKIQVLVSKDLKLRANVTVMDGAQKVSGATVYLFSGTKISGQAISDSNGKAVFALDETGSYSLQASKENYLPGKKLVFSTSSYEKGSVQNFDLNLEKCTPQKCGLLTIRITDEDELAVENATISLLGEDGLVATAFGTRTTDFNGFAKFQNVTAGKFYALAQKFPAEGRSEIIEMDPTVENKIEMKITIGLGNVVVKALDIDGKPLSGMNVELFTSIGRSLGSVPVGENGTGTIKIKADKKVYAVFRKEGYASHFTVSRQVFPNKNLEFSATLDRAISGDSPRILYKGFSSEQGQAAESLRSGFAYTGKFVVEIPSDIGFEQSSAFFRAGDKQKSDGDVLQIEEINAPTLLVSDGSAYDPPLGNDEQDENGSGKWILLDWKNPAAGRYEIEVKVRVKQGLVPGTELGVYYRAQAQKDARYYRHPQDTVLGSEKDNAQKKGFYANSHQIRLLEGIAELCRGEFCFSHRVLDKTENLYVDDPYKLRAYSPYDLEFVLINNSDKDYTGSAMSVKNLADKEDILISLYSIRNADNSIFSSAEKVFEIPRFSAGEFTKNRRVSGNLSVEMLATQPSILQFKIFSNKEERFSGAIPFTPYTDGSIELSVKPENLVAFIPLNLEIKAAVASGEESGFPVEGAKIFVKRLSPDRSETITNALTDNQGNAKIQVPASSPGTKIIVWAQKAGLASNTVEREVGASVVLLEPARISTQVNMQTKAEVRDQIEITNLISTPVVIKGLAWSVESKGLLEEQRMDNFLQQFVGREIVGNDTAAIALLSVIGNEAQFLEKPKKISGLLIMELGLKGDANTLWVSRVPYEVTVNLAQMPKNAPCISVSESSWEDSTVDGKSSFEFDITNNCISEDEREIELSNLQAGIDWSGGIVGIVELSVSDPKSKETSREILQQALSHKLLAKLEYGIPYHARLSFVPKPNSMGKEAEFSVSIDAEIKTNTGPRLVGATNDIEASIKVADLDRCIKFNPSADEVLRLNPGDEEIEFTLDTAECGPLELDVRICAESGNEFCRGGTSDGGITVEPLIFNRLKQESRTVRVQRQDIPGLYGITVQARPSGGSFRKIAEIETVVEPEKGLYFSLDKYKLAMIGQGAKDEVKLTNDMVQEKVQVTASICDWDEASDDTDFEEDFLYTTFWPISTLFFDDPCEDDRTSPVTDYVINLAGSIHKREGDRYVLPDALDVKISYPGLGAEWFLDRYHDFSARTQNGKQQVGIVFSNNAVSTDNPVYAIVTARAKEHVHGDPLHKSPAVECSGSDFGSYWINPGTCGGKQNTVYDTDYSQSFHVKIQTSQPQNQVPKVTFDTLACESGFDVGRTGHGALARIKLDWEWKNTSINQCDASNPEYVYCDATQFTIELNKKIAALDGFLQANDYDLGCPPAAENPNSNTLAVEVPSGKLGLAMTAAEIDGTIIRAIVTAKNNTALQQDAVVKVRVTDFSQEVPGCTTEIAGIAPGQEKQGMCEINTGSNGTYGLSSVIESASTEDFSSTAAEAIVLVGRQPRENPQADCGLKTTRVYYQTPHIMRFVEGKNNIKWTSQVPDKEALQNLLVFDSYLIRDNYSKEFFRDFKDYYSNNAFEDADYFFDQMGQDSSGKAYGLATLIEQDKFSFSNRYIATSELSGPGLYRVELGVNFNKDDWHIFNSSGRLDANVEVTVHRLSDPRYDSPFYFMPFDGLVGIEGETTRRQNYGTTFLNEGAVGNVSISKGPNPMKTFQDNESNPLARISVKQNKDIYSLNTAPISRGMLLEAGTGPGSGNIVFQQSLATPLMLKVTTGRLYEEKFNANYSILENGSRTTTGTSLAYWTGAGSCIDYSGIPVTEAFYEKADRQAEEGEGIIDYQSVYVVDWPKSQRKGDVYLRTIAYTNASKDTKIRINQNSLGTFQTPDEQGNQVSLNGIAAMPFNDSSKGSNGRVESIQDVFNLVKSNHVCVTNTGSTARFFWNPQSIYTAQGQQRNISQVSNSLEAASTCIG